MYSPSSKEGVVEQNVWKALGEISHATMQWYALVQITWWILIIILVADLSFAHFTSCMYIKRGSMALRLHGLWRNIMVIVVFQSSCLLLLTHWRPLSLNSLFWSLLIVSDLDYTFIYTLSLLLIYLLCSKSVLKQCTF